MDISTTSGTEPIEDPTEESVTEDNYNELKFKSYYLPKHLRVSFENWEEELYNTLEIEYGQPPRVFIYLLHLFMRAPHHRWILIHKWKRLKSSFAEIVPTARDVDLIIAKGSSLRRLMISEIIQMVIRSDCLDAYWDLTADALGCSQIRSNTTVESRGCDKKYWHDVIRGGRRKRRKSIPEDSEPIVKDPEVLGELIELFVKLERIRKDSIDSEEDLRSVAYVSALFKLCKRADFTTIETLFLLCSASESIGQILIDKLYTLGEKLCYTEEGIAVKDFVWIENMILEPVLILYTRNQYSLLLDKYRSEVARYKVKLMLVKENLEVYQIPKPDDSLRETSSLIVECDLDDLTKSVADLELEECEADSTSTDWSWKPMSKLTDEVEDVMSLRTLEEARQGAVSESEKKEIDQAIKDTESYIEYASKEKTYELCEAEIAENSRYLEDKLDLLERTNVESLSDHEYELHLYLRSIYWKQLEIEKMKTELIDRVKVTESMPGEEERTERLTIFTRLVLYSERNSRDLMKILRKDLSEEERDQFSELDRFVSNSVTQWKQQQTLLLGFAKTYTQEERTECLHKTVDYTIRTAEESLQRFHKHSQNLLNDQDYEIVRMLVEMTHTFLIGERMKRRLLYKTQDVNNTPGVKQQRELAEIHKVLIEIGERNLDQIDRMRAKSMGELALHQVEGMEQIARQMIKEAKENLEEANQSFNLDLTSMESKLEFINEKESETNRMAGTAVPWSEDTKKLYKEIIEVASLNTNFNEFLKDIRKSYDDLVNMKRKLSKSKRTDCSNLKETWIALGIFDQVIKTGEEILSKLRTIELQGISKEKYMEIRILENSIRKYVSSTKYDRDLFAETRDSGTSDNSWTFDYKRALEGAGDVSHD